MQIKIQITISIPSHHPKNSELNIWNTEVWKGGQLKKEMRAVIEIQPATKVEALGFTRDVREFKRTLASKQWSQKLLVYT